MPATRPSTPGPAGDAAGNTDPGSTDSGSTDVGTTGTGIMTDSGKAGATITGPVTDPEPGPVNRAARRGKARDQVPAAARYRGSAGQSRPAQGRRINPVRRTG